MPVPSGWEWIEELPEGWSPPPELRQPSKSAYINLAIRMLSRENLGNDITDLIGQFISEHARFSIWFGSEAKGRLELPKLAQLMIDGEETTRRTYEAWLVFSRAFDAAGGLWVAIESEYAALRETLRDAVTELAELRRNS